MNTLMLSVLLACGTTAPHDHAHDEGGDHDHAEEAHHDHAEEAHPDKSTAAHGAIEAPMGAHTARLNPSAGALELVVLDAQGTPVAAEGEARILLTGTGEEAQRVVLTAAGEAWTGAAKAEGAPGYLAVVNVTVGGNKESARLTWGTVPEAAPAPEPHDHGGHDDGGHDHGEGGHTH